MPNSEKEAKTITDLLLQGHVAKVPISVRGSLENGELGELSGQVELNRPLARLLDDLGGIFQDAARFLRQIMGGKAEDVILDSLSFGYCNQTPKFARLVVTMRAAGNVYRFVLVKMTGQDGVMAGLDLKWDRALFRGSIISGLVGEISLGNLGLYYASQDIQAIRFDPDRDFQERNVLSLPIPASDARSFNKGLNLSAQISIGRISLLDWLEKSKEAKDEQQAPAVPKPAGGTPEAAEELPSALGTRWVKVDKTIGPLFVKRIGLGYKAPEVAIQFDAGVDLSCITMTLLGFGLSYPLSEMPKTFGDFLKKLTFRLDGASLALTMGPVSIAGGLLKVSDLPLELTGTLMVRAGELTIGAIGSYADLNGTPSLFIFAALQKALGGPPYFFIMGIALGFGINRALMLPAISDVHLFPLIRAATEPAYLGQKLDLRDISLKLDHYIYPSPRNYWLAAGLKFTSFGMINAFAMVTVSMGTQFQFALLGLAKITVPVQVPGMPEKDPIACAELAMKVVLTLSTGVLAVEAQLTANSFLFSRQCRLTGGFAFYCWFKSPHAGDFVVSLGGYHPRFSPPPHYPLVPRLGLNWAISSHLSITGEIYFALTPSCCMAGGKLDAVFAVGNLRAWFYAYADFLLSWKPFYYDAAIGVSIGVSYRMNFFGVKKTFSIELGAMVHLWGPPFGGIAHISWFIISFDISFGSRQNPVPPPIGWDEFHQSFLPQQSDGVKSATNEVPDPRISTIRITGGLIREQKIEEQGKTHWIVNGHEFSFATDTLVPCTELSLNDRKLDPGQVNPAGLGIRPMGKVSLQSRHAIVVKREGLPAEGWDRYLESSCTRKNMPYALWSNDLTRPDQPSAKQIENVPCGVAVSLKSRPPIHGLQAIELKKFQYIQIDKNIVWTEIDMPVVIVKQDVNLLRNTLWGNPEVDKKREAILRTLADAGLPLRKIEVSELAAHLSEVFQSLPMIWRARRRKRSGDEEP